MRILASLLIFFGSVCSSSLVIPSINIQLQVLFGSSCNLGQGWGSSRAGWVICEGQDYYRSTDKNRRLRAIGKRELSTAPLLTTAHYCLLLLSTYHYCSLLLYSLLLYSALYCSTLILNSLYTGNLDTITMYCWQYIIERPKLMAGS